MPADTSATLTRVPASGARRAQPRRARRPAAAAQVLPGLLLLAFVVFFVLPVIWLLLAATKTDSQLVQDNPLSFGSWHVLRENWDALTGFQGDVILLWLRNSALYASLALVITLAAGIPAGYALAMTEFPGRRLLLVTTLVVMLMPGTTLVVPLFLEINAVHLIGSHGQTVFHQGTATSFCGRRVASTLQIGEPSVIAQRTGIATVGDFRPADMAAGGQGAPLVPFVDYFLYRDSRVGRAALNIGGIANVTVIPRAAKIGDVFAFDIGPGNMVIDALVRRFSRGRKAFDRNAEMAVRGEVLPGVLRELLRNPYFRKAPPKTAGREQYGEGRAVFVPVLQLARVVSVEILPRAQVP